MADAGDARAQILLGMRYATGDGVPRSDAEAMRWYRKAADQGYADGQYHLAARYLFGKGVPPNPAQAVHWLNLAAIQRHPSAQNALGVLYRNGNGSPRTMRPPSAGFKKPRIPMMPLDSTTLV